MRWNKMLIYCKYCFQVYFTEDGTDINKLRMKCGRCNRSEWELAI